MDKKDTWLCQACATRYSGERCRKCFPHRPFIQFGESANVQPTADPAVPCERLGICKLPSVPFLPEWKTALLERAAYIPIPELLEEINCHCLDRDSDWDNLDLAVEMIEARLNATFEKAAKYYETHTARLHTNYVSGQTSRYQLIIRDLELFGSEQAMADAIRNLGKTNG